MSATIYIVGNMIADTVTIVNQTLGLVKEAVVVMVAIVILVTSVAYGVIGHRGLRAFTDRFHQHPNHRWIV